MKFWDVMLSIGVVSLILLGLAYYVNSADSGSKSRDEGLNTKITDVEKKTDDVKKTVDEKLKLAQGDAGTSCWDLNMSGENDPEEDVNEDGVFDAKDCQGESKEGPMGPVGDPGVPGECKEGQTCEFFAVCCSTDNKPTVTPVAKKQDVKKPAKKEKVKKDKAAALYFVQKVTVGESEFTSNARGVSPDEVRDVGLNIGTVGGSVIFAPVNVGN